MRTWSGVVLKRFYQIVFILVIVASVSMPVNVRAQSNDGDLIEAVATEAAQSLGWDPYEKWMNGNGDTINIYHDSICGERVVSKGEFIQIRAFSDSSRTDVTQNTTFHGYPAEYDGYSSSLLWPMGRFLLRASALECNDFNYMDVAEALYAASVAHKLGVKRRCPLLTLPRLLRLRHTRCRVRLPMDITIRYAMQRCVSRLG